MKGKRVTVEVSWDLDQVPGWNYTPNDVIDMLERELQRIDHYDPATRTATRTVVPGKSPLYRIQMAVGEDDPAIGVLELSGVVDGYDRADTGLGDRLYCIRFKDAKVGAPE